MLLNATIIPLPVFVIHVTFRFKLTMNGSPKLHTQKFTWVEDADIYW